ncbi:hypothetical protein GN244_ATG17457 [Phytophthora infestans]|uniref:Secreted RxLR effector peptide protein n=1 Tax=Phytophthora infestans TaxID=4787 RepID=A0A833SYT1_PHYIN|nr:hypothetical protein GN244_ATG17457 [Phytophthora infestans]KAF4142603.1 hypothetical protein GN958_ATG08204 [Phytophthora infestans]
MVSLWFALLTLAIIAVGCDALTNKEATDPKNTFMESTSVNGNGGSASRKMLLRRNGDEFLEDFGTEEDDSSEAADNVTK